MKWLKRIFWLLIIIIAVGAGAWWYLPTLNEYQTEGSIALPGLDRTVTVKRDAKNMAYIHAQNLPDALFAQGFVTAQDRLFQMQVTRLLAQGRISELAGDKAIGLDTMMRAIGIHRLAKQQAEALDDLNRALFNKYIAGVNAFIEQCPKQVHLEFKLAGIKPELWSIADSLCILYFMGWSTSGDLKNEVVAQMLVDKMGRKKTQELMPLNINPDDPGPPQNAKLPASGAAGLRLAWDGAMQTLLTDMPLGLGSNNWAAAPRFNPKGKAILAGDPHLDARILPGPWYPLGIVTPEIRAVGCNIAGLPGMAVGRTEHIAIAMTNSYADVQDLYVETLDPGDSDRYMEGDKSLPFKVVEETLSIKDSDAENGLRREKIKIRFTGRGPVVSGLLKGLKTDKVLTLRWAAGESVLPRIGMSQFLTAKSAAELDTHIQDISMILLNWMFADAQGNIGWRVSGRVPIRTQTEAGIPYVVKSGADNWEGWIPQEYMPHKMNPERGWLGTCNHTTVDRDYPFYYSSYAASSFRYARLKELLSAPGPKPAEMHWQFQRDTVNLMARRIAPIMARALAAHPQTKDLADSLNKWEFRDEMSSVGAAIFQAVYLEFARQVFGDELGPDVLGPFLDNWYFWQERLQQLVIDGNSHWFDDKATPDKKETRDQMFQRAALAARARLGERLGDDPGSWHWGKLHTLELVSPLHRQGPGKALLGTGPLPMAGSGETLYRGIYRATQPYGVTISAALRMVVDFADPDKVAAVIPGGVTGRVFSPYQTDQVQAYMDGTKLYWWFSDKAINEHTKHTLALEPR